MRKRLMAAVALMAMPGVAVAQFKEGARPPAPAPSPTSSPSQLPPCETEQSLPSGALMKASYGRGRSPSSEALDRFAVRLGRVSDDDQAPRTELRYRLGDRSLDITAVVRAAASPDLRPRANGDSLERRFLWQDEVELRFELASAIDFFVLSVGGNSETISDRTPIANDAIRTAVLGGQAFTLAKKSGDEVGRPVPVRLDARALAQDSLVARRAAEALLTRLIDEQCAVPASGCYLTTAAVTAVGLADDCWELRALRRFRDTVMAGTASGRAMIRAYYDTAPALIARIEQRADARRVWLRTYVTGILPCAVLARLGLNRRALKGYRAMAARLEAEAAASGHAIAS